MWTCSSVRKSKYDQFFYYKIASEGWIKLLFQLSTPFCNGCKWYMKYCVKTVTASWWKMNFTFFIVKNIQWHYENSLPKSNLNDCNEMDSITLLANEEAKIIFAGTQSLRSHSYLLHFLPKTIPRSGSLEIDN